MSSLDYQHILEAGIASLGLTIPAEKIQQLLQYHALLVKWNKAYNLTAVRDPEQMISRHLLDSLSIVEYLDGNRFIDVGTGAGLPGIVLAIIFPEKQFDLLDSNGKKTRFLFQVKTELALGNVTVHHCRVESLEVSALFDGVISRAFASLEDMVNGSTQLLAEGGRFYAMKGLVPDDEIEQLKQLSHDGKNYKVESCHSLNVPGEDGQRHLLLISTADD